MLPAQDPTAVTQIASGQSSAYLAVKEPVH